MATAAAVAGVVGAVAGVTSAVTSGVQGAKANKIASKQADIQTQQTKLNAQNSVRDYEKSIADLEGSKIQHEIDIRDAQTQVQSYDKWLANYGGQYAQEVSSKQAQTDQLQASGKETYENFLNAIGYSDAQAGATGRKGGNTSQGQTTGLIDRKLVEYAGEDRTLDANGGLFGSQLTAANMEMQQLKVDLDFQRQEMEANRANSLASIADYQRAIDLTNQSIEKSAAAKTDMQQFIDDNFNDKKKRK
ncbi:MAG: hypothetical protein LBP76_10275 [Treponema sp.]|jgi:hypothetical protein|nr:hypothetical protein [Treponema sp.]